MAFEAKLWDGDEWNMKRKRFVAWGIIALVILIPAFLTIDKHRGYHPRMLEEMLSPMSGSLLSNDSSQFGISGFEYGEDFPTTVKMLDLQEWFTEERIDSILGELEQAKGQCNQAYADSRFYFTAFGGKKYTLLFNFSKDLKCYMLEFICSFEDPEVIPAMIASNQEVNPMTYEDSCQYFYELLSAFKDSYGVPYQENTSFTLQSAQVDNVAKNPYSICNDAQWLITGDTGSSILCLYAAPITDVYTDDTTLNLVIRINVAKEIPGVSLDEIMDSLPY